MVLKLLWVKDFFEKPIKTVEPNLIISVHKKSFLLFQEGYRSPKTPPWTLGKNPGCRAILLMGIIVTIHRIGYKTPTAGFHFLQMHRVAYIMCHIKGPKKISRFTMYVSKWQIIR